jgi:hypothetical protein
MNENRVLTIAFTVAASIDIYNQVHKKRQGSGPAGVGSSDAEANVGTAVKIDMLPQPQHRQPVPPQYYHQSPPGGPAPEQEQQYQQQQWMQPTSPVQTTANTGRYGFPELHGVQYHQPTSPPPQSAAELGQHR